MATIAAIASSSNAAASYSDYETLSFQNVSIDGMQGSQTFTTSMLYTIVYNDDKTLTVEAEIPEKVTKIVGFVPEMHFKGARDGEGDQYIAMVNTDGIYKATSTFTFDEGAELTDLFFWLKYAGGVSRFDIKGYTVGTEKAATVGNPIITGEATNITSTSAEINWNVLEGAGMENPVNTVYFDGNVTTQNPIVLTDLTPNTSYSYTLKVVSNFNGKDYTSEEVTVSFKTLRENAVALTYYGKVSMEFANCSFDAASPDNNRVTKTFEIPYTIVFNPDETLTISITKPAEMDGLVGLASPSVSADGEWKDFVDFSYTTVKTFTENTDINMFFYWPYNGGAARKDFVYKVGSTSNNPTGVKNIVNSSNPDEVTYYNLQGIRVTKPVAGRLYIVNGKKIIVK